MNFCLSCIIDDILALPDITEVESHRLSELCRILHALEGLFIDDPEQVCAHASVVFPFCSYGRSLPSSLGVCRRGSSFRIFPNSWYVFVFGQNPNRFEWFSLQEASLADISYLFDEGALVDYETQELIKLVRALFADTPQRTNMINKLMAGHSHPSMIS